MVDTIERFIQKYGVDEIHRETGIPKPNIKQYLRGQKPNQFSAIVLYEFSLKVGDVLDVLKPQEDIWYVQFARWLIRHNKSPYSFAHEYSIPGETVRNLLTGIVSDVNRLTGKTRKMIYEATIKEGEPLEILRPEGYKPPLSKRMQPSQVPKDEYESPTRDTSNLKDGLIRLFDAAVDLLPQLRDSLDPENLKELASQQPQNTKEMPVIAKNLADGLGRILEHYVSASPQERETFRRAFYGDKRAVINLAQLIDSLRTEEGVERLQSLRSIR